MNFFYQFLRSRKADARTAIAPTIRQHVSFWSYLLLGGLDLCSGNSEAQNKAASENSSDRSSGFVGLGVNVAPRYQGADETRTTVIPGFEYHWTNGLFVGGTDGLVGFQIDAAPQLKLGVALGLDEGREASDSRYLAGMGDVVGRGTLNIHAKAVISEQFGLSAGLRLGSGNFAKGSLLYVGARYGVLLAPTTRMSFNLEATYANADYMQNYYGVSPEQVGASGYTRYTPDSGLRDITIGLELQHNLSREWMLFAKLDSTSLSNELRNSPLVRKGTSQSAFAGIAYSF